MTEKAKDIVSIMTEIYRPILKSDFYLSYFGVFTDDITQHLIEWVQSKLENDPEIKKSNIKKTSFLLAETYQNIVRHKVKFENEAPASSRDFPEGFQININKGSVQIVCTNRVKSADSHYLESAVEEVASSSKEELKEMWVERLTNSGFTKNGGAGLGLIEIARKIDHPIQYSFEDIDSLFQLFSMTVSFNVDGRQSDDVDQINYRELYTKQVKHKAIFGYKGVMDPKFYQVIISILETQFNSLHMSGNVHESNLVVARKSLANFKEFGKLMGGQVRGYFGLGLAGQQHFLYFGYFIEDEKVQRLSDGQLKLVDNVELKEDRFFEEYAAKHAYSISDNKFDSYFISYAVYMK